jgi:hypothetical protein
MRNMPQPISHLGVKKHYGKAHSTLEQILPPVNVYAHKKYQARNIRNEQCSQLIIDL